MQKMKILILTCSLLGIFYIPSTFSQTTPVHTWHTVSTTEGTWHAKLQNLNQESYFVDRAGASINQFVIHPNRSQDYGFGFYPGADFNIAYTLTIIEESTFNFSSKACVYVITASAPATPDIRVNAFNGAKCDWKIIKGVGENFMVS